MSETDLEPQSRGGFPYAKLETSPIAGASADRGLYLELVTAPHMANNRKGHLVAISLRTIAAAAGPSAPRQPQPAGAGCAPDASTRESTLSVIATAAPMRAHAARIKRPTVKPPVRSLK